MAKRSKNFKKAPKPNILDFLKGLTMWLCTNNPSQEDLKKLLKTYPDVSINFIFNKIMSYNMTYPHIIWYCNKYLNNFYDFSSLSRNKALHQENKIHLINTLKNLMDINFQSQRNKLFYLKGKDLKDENRGQIKKLINEYFQTVYNKMYNEKELDFFYTLFEKGQIMEEELYKADEALHNGKKTLKLNMTTTGFENYEMTPQQNIMSGRQYLEYCRKRQLPSNITAYCQSLIDIKKERHACVTCMLYHKPMVILDTNMEAPGPIDVMFVGLNPGREEVTYNKTFIGGPSLLLREKIMKFHPNTKWVITNIIMCHTPNEKDIGDWEPVAANCAHKFLTDVTQKFPPKVFVTIGRQCKDFFKVPGMISKVSGKIHDHGNCKIIPLIHPSSVARSRDKNGAIFESSWKNIYPTVEKLPITTPCADQSIELNAQQTDCSIFLHPENMIKEVTDDLMLFDIVNLDNEKILQIFIDAQGKKKYMMIDYELPVYIKFSNNWSHNSMITDKVDAFVKIPGKQRYYVNKLLRDQMESIKAI